MFFPTLLALTLIGVAASPARAQDLSSHRINEIFAEPVALRASAVQTLLDSLKRAGGPLVESNSSSDATAIVTFLWEGEPGVNSVVVVTPSTLYDFSGSVMERLAGTDTWYLSRKLPTNTRFAYRFEVDGPLKPFHEDPQFFQRLPTWLPDPTNPRFFVYETGDTASVLELDRAPDPGWSRGESGARRGTIYNATVASKALRGDRAVWVYRPAGYDPAHEPYPTLVLTDGRSYLSQLSVNNTLDNLIDAGQIPPLLVVGVTSSERGQDLRCNPDFGVFIAEELLPWLETRENAAARPEAVAIGGYSLGGLAAACAALQHPGRIGMVLAQSGSFRRSEPGASDPEAVARLIAESERRPIRFYLEVGTEEIGPLFGEDPSTLTANRHLRDVLTAKGYEVTYVERSSGHEPVAWRETLHLGLKELFGR